MTEIKPDEWYRPDQHPHETWVIGDWQDSFGQVAPMAFYCDSRGTWWRGATGNDGGPVLHYGDAPLRWKTIPWEREAQQP